MATTRFNTICALRRSIVALDLHIMQRRTFLEAFKVMRYFFPGSKADLSIQRTSYDVIGYMVIELDSDDNKKPFHLMLYTNLFTICIPQEINNYCSYNIYYKNYDVSRHKKEDSATNYSINSNCRNRYKSFRQVYDYIKKLEYKLPSYEFRNENIGNNYKSYYTEFRDPIISYQNNRSVREGRLAALYNSSNHNDDLKYIRVFLNAMLT